MAVNRKNRLDSIFRSISDGILTFDTRGIVTYANPAAEMLIGRKERSIVGVPIQSLVTPETLETLDSILSETAASEHASFEIRVAREQGGTASLDITSDPIREGNGEHGTIWVLRDASARKNLEQKRADFFAALTHDVKNALGIIMSSAEILLLKARERKTKQDEKVLERMMNNTFTVQALVSNYVDLSMIESGQLNLARKSIDLNAVLRWVSRQHEIVAERRGITLELQLAAALPAVEGDPLCLERIVANLLHNALKFTPDKGRVTVSSSEVAGGLAVRIQDTGPGIEPNDIPFIFEKYGRAPTASAEGQGLGLFIVKELVEAQRGKIEVESTPGQGSCFSVLFPVNAGGV